MKIKERKGKKKGKDSHSHSLSISPIADVFLYDELFNKTRDSLELEHPDWDEDRIIKTVKAILSNHYSYR